MVWAPIKPTIIDMMAAKVTLPLKEKMMTPMSNTRMSTTSAAVSFAWLVMWFDPAR